MTIYKVTYTGRSSKFKGYKTRINASSEREAIERVYKSVMPKNYFPQKDGSILDSNGNKIATPTSGFIEYDGGLFIADKE